MQDARNLGALYALNLLNWRNVMKTLAKAVAVLALSRRACLPLP